jgi:hypothetical protein
MNPQLDTNLAFRFSFKVPRFSKTGKLTDYRLEHRVVSNLIEKTDLYAFYGSTQRFVNDADGQHFVNGSRAALAKKFGLTEDQAALIQYVGYSVCEHRPVTQVDVNDPRWI